MRIHRPSGVFNNAECSRLTHQPCKRSRSLQARSTSFSTSRGGGVSRNGLARCIIVGDLDVVGDAALIEDIPFGRMQNQDAADGPVVTALCAHAHLAGGEAVDDLRSNLDAECRRVVSHFKRPPAASTSRLSME